MVTGLLVYKEQSPEGITRNSSSKSNGGVNFFPVFIFGMVFLCVSIYQSVVCPPNASELELLEVLVKNSIFLDPTKDILNPDVWR